MSLPNQKPDLEDSINVTEAHGRLVREAAAAAREKRIADNGREPVSLWIFVACAVALLVAGGILSAGGFFKYGSTFKEGYVRTPAPGADDSGPKPKEALEAYSAKGAKIYTSKCIGCHGADARGDGANYPSLVGSKWVTGETEILSQIILNGLQGPTSYGHPFGAGIMPSQAAGLNAMDVASLMTYLRNSLGNSTGDIVTVEMGQAALDLAAARKNPGVPVTAEEINNEHKKNLPGETLDPKSMVNPVTLEPATDTQ
ncbi:MAG: cytochrome c [Luteolibacter sp.]